MGLVSSPRTIRHGGGVAAKAELGGQRHHAAQQGGVAAVAAAAARQGHDVALVWPLGVERLSQEAPFVPSVSWLILVHPMRCCLELV